MSEIYQQISESLQKGKVKDVKEYVTQAINDGLPVKDILEKGLLDGMGIIGEKFKNNEVYVPEVLIAARAMNSGAEILKPLLAEGGVEAKGRVAIGTIKGDLHDIGKNLVKMMMEGKGLEVIDCGVDVSPEKFLETYKTENVDVIACSALLTTTMNGIKDVVELFKSEGLRDKVTIMCGGAPVTEAFCKSIGADIYTADAASAADAAVEACRK